MATHFWEDFMAFLRTHWKTLFPRLLALGFGMAAAICYFFWMLHSSITSPLEAASTLLYLSFFFSFPAYWLLFRFSFPSLENYNLKTRWLLLEGSLLFGIVLSLAIPLPLPTLPVAGSLEVIATGEKNFASKASEVWVTSLSYTNGTQVSFSEFTLGEGWELRENSIASFQGEDQPTTLSWRGYATENMKLVLLAHPWSGIVDVRWNGQSQRIDLYADPATSKQIDLTVQPVLPRLRYRLLYFITSGITLGLLLFAISAWLVGRKNNTSIPAQVTTNRFSWLWYAIPMIVVSLIYLIAYWPGVMTNDSNDQWNQVFTGNFNGWHPAFHTFNIWLLTRIWASPAIVAMAQILATSLVIAWGIAELRRNGTSIWASWGTVSMFCLIPIYPQMMITLWKDVAYSVSMLALSILALKIVFSDGKWLNTKSAWVKLGIVSALVALYRHNGPPVAFGFVIIAGVYYRSYWKKLLMGLILGIGLWQLITGPVYDHFKVIKSKEDIIPAISFYGIAAHIVDDPTILSYKNEHYLIRLLPLKGWGLYDCHSATTMSFSPLFSKEAYLQVDDRLLGTYVELTQEKPFITINHVLCATSYLWKIESEPGQYYLGTVTYRNGIEMLQEENIKSFGYNLLYFASTIHRTPIPDVRDFINSWSASLYDETSGTLSRPALYLYLMAFAVVVYSLRNRSFAMSLVAVPSLIQTGIMFVASLNSELRYQYPIFLAGLLFFLPLITCMNSSNGSKNSKETLCN